MHAGKQTFIYENPPEVVSHFSVVGPKEGKGPLAGTFDVVADDDLFGQTSWELAESEMLKTAIVGALDKAGMTSDRAEAMFSGDLNNQIIATGFAARALKLPFVGLYGACSTFVKGLVLASAFISGGFLHNALCSASSHFCTAERQFRFPLELGNQRPPSASWTATAAGCAFLRRSDHPNRLRVTSGTLGRVEDYGIKDTNHMGAAMAPAVLSVIRAHFEDTGKTFDDYDRIVTGDLGWIGRDILVEQSVREDFPLPSEKLIDCGASLYFREQDTHAGGSGCGCVASVACGTVMKAMEAGEYRRVLLVGSGAMHSPTSAMQAQSIPGIAYAAALEVI